MTSQYSNNKLLWILTECLDVPVSDCRNPVQTNMLQQQLPPLHPNTQIFYALPSRAGFNYVIAKDTRKKEPCDNRQYVKCLLVAKHGMHCTATYFDRMYRCGKEEALLRLVTTKISPYVGNGQGI